MDYFLTRGRLLSLGEHLPFFKPMGVLLSASVGAVVSSQTLHQIQLLRNMPRRSDSDLTYAEQKRGERETEKA